MRGMTFETSAIRAALTFALALSLGVVPSVARQRPRARTRGKKTEAASQTKAAGEPATEVARLRAQFVQATKDYKASLEKLLPFYEADVKRKEEKLAKTKELYAEGLVAKRDIEKDEAEAAAAREKVAAVRGQLKSADEQMAETLVEAEAEESAAKEAAKAARATRLGGGLIQTAAYIRYGGARAWSLSEAGAVEQFFRGRFGRALPVSSFGQSPVHDRWGYDHHNAMDVGLSPDSAEGRALMEYLRASGVPFTAFRFAIPGTATGPHIHVGRPSHKVAPK
jgi:hypothetical protein